MNNIALSYFEGIFEKCAMYGIDPEWLVKNAIPLRSAAEVAMSRFPRRVSGMVTPLYSHAQVAAGGLNPHIRPRLEPMPVGPMNIEPDAQLRNLIEQRLRLSELRGEAPVRIAPPKFDNIGKLDVKSIISAPGTHARETPPVETAGVPAEPVPAAIPKAAPAAGGGFMEGVNRVLRPVGTLATLGTVGAGTVGTYKGLQGLEPFLQDYETLSPEMRAHVDRFPTVKGMFSNSVYDDIGEFFRGGPKVRNRQGTQVIAPTPNQAVVQNMMGPRIEQ